MPIYLQAIAAQFYRSIGPETQYISGFSDMNFFIGPNNAGKSVVLNLIHDRLPFGKKVDAKADQNSPENYRGAISGECVVAAGVSQHRIVELFEAKYPGKLDSYAYGTQPLRQEVAEIAKNISKHQSVWITRSESRKPAAIWNKPDIDEATKWISGRSWERLWTIVTHQTGGGPKMWAEQTLFNLYDAIKPTYPECLMIPAKRKLGPKDETFYDQSGKGLINHLAAMQNPDHHEQEKRQTFDQINAFVRAVTGKPDAQLNVPDSKEHLLIHMDNKVLPLESLGTGIHEVILIAAFCTIHQQKIMCIEEPEIHLHPILQRKLIRYLQEKTDNQYFIATHSAAFIDTLDASVYRVNNDGVQTYVTPALLRGERRQICDDLGYKASDIMQANAVIWVEGPSDRIYLKHWISAVDDTLIEGVHYSILFYGGSLIKHLSADEDAVTDFIKLRELNRNFAVVLDSDKATAQSPLKPAAKRIQEELQKGGGIAWITKGREVENYLRPDLLQDALKAIHSDIYDASDAVGPYDHAFYFKRKRADKKGELIHKTGDKVGAANKVCAAAADLSILDLKPRILDLVAMITRANGP